VFLARCCRRAQKLGVPRDKRRSVYRNGARGIRLTPLTNCEYIRAWRKYSHSFPQGLMSKRTTLALTRRESQIMEILYRRRRATAEEIRSELPEAPGGSSVRKLLDIMMDRGLLGREYDGPRYMYFPAAKPEEASRSALQQLVRTFFDNSPSLAMA